MFDTIWALRFLNALRDPFWLTFWFVLHLVLVDSNAPLFIFVEDEDEEDMTGDEHIDWWSTGETNELDDEDESTLTMFSFIFTICV